MACLDLKLDLDERLISNVQLTPDDAFLSCECAFGLNRFSRRG